MIRNGRVTPEQSLSAPPGSGAHALATTQVPATGATGRGPLPPRELSQFLMDMSIALHRRAMYPPGHPALLPALDRLARRAEGLFESRPRFAIGIAPDQLVIDGVATDLKQPLLRSLAERLHRHHLAAVDFSRGLTADEIADVIAAISEDPDRGGAPLGARRERGDAWSHVKLYSLSMNGLGIASEPGTGTPGEAVPSVELWIGLARAALERNLEGEANDGGLQAEPAVLARAIDEHQRIEAYDEVIVGYLLKIAGELRSAGESEARELRRRTSMLISAMQPETLRRLLGMGGDVMQRHRFVADASSGMAAGAVVDLVRAAAEASSENISHGLVRLFSKLAVHAETGTETVRPLADSALRDQVVQLIENWNLEDPNPTAYTGMLRGFSARAMPGTPRALGEAPTPIDDALRIVKMSVELDEASPSFWRSIDVLVADGQLPTIVSLIDHPPGQGVTRLVWERLLSADFVRGVLDSPNPDLESLDCLMPFLGGAAMTPMFDVLLDSTDRHVRRSAFDRLRQAGPLIARDAVARLTSDSRWFARRNLLALLAQLDELPDDFDAMRYLRDADARVRREALRVALRRSERRAEALRTALTDQDSRVLLQALHAAHEECPSAIVSSLLTVAVDIAHEDEVRVMAIRALGTVDHGAEGLKALLAIAAGEPRLFRRRALQPKSRPMLAALRVIAAQHGSDREVSHVVRKAIASSDLDIRQAAGGAA